MVSLNLGRKERTGGSDYRFFIWTTPVDTDSPDHLPIEHPHLLEAWTTNLALLQTAHI